MGMSHKLSGAEPMAGDDLDYRQLLRRARIHADERNFDDVLIVDADFHHTEARAWSEILAYVDNDVLRHMLREGSLNGEVWIPGLVDNWGVQQVSGRIQNLPVRDRAFPDVTGAEGDLRLVRETMDATAIDYISFFPDYLLDLGVVKYELEAPLATAWAHWVTDRILPEEPRLITLLPLPLSDPGAALRLVERFGDKRGVVGFMVTSVRYEPLHGKQFAKVFRAIEERGLTLGFHALFNIDERPIRQLNRFMTIHTISFPLYHAIQAANWVVNGMPERYPDLKVLFIEGGLAWIPSLMQRMDHEYRMRVSEAPLLQRRPSEYLRDFYYTSQPLEAADLRFLELTFEMINAKTQVLYASDWPHWDWDPPRKIWDLPFLDEEAKRNILGLNAQRLYGLDMTVRQPAEMTS
jgi:predicted TIM-barrel fold metal-dependent hydrolase